MIAGTPGGVTHTQEDAIMAGLMSKVARFAQGPQGRKLAERAKRASADPKNRRKIEELRGRISRKRP